MFILAFQVDCKEEIKKILFMIDWKFGGGTKLMVWSGADVITNELWNSYLTALIAISVNVRHWRHGYCEHLVFYIWIKRSLKKCCPIISQKTTICAYNKNFRWLNWETLILVIIFKWPEKWPKKHSKMTLNAKFVF